MPYVMVPHEPDVWLRAHVEKRWNSEGRWRLSVYYFVGLRQHYRSYDADHCRPVDSAAEFQDVEQRDASAPANQGAGL